MIKRSASDFNDIFDFTEYAVQHMHTKRLMVKRVYDIYEDKHYYIAIEVHHER